MKEIVVKSHYIKIKSSVLPKILSREWEDNILKIFAKDICSKGVLS
jgi:hypothetical protein